MSYGAEPVGAESMAAGSVERIGCAARRHGEARAGAGTRRRVAAAVLCVVVTGCSTSAAPPSTSAPTAGRVVSTAPATPSPTPVPVLAPFAPVLRLGSGEVAFSGDPFLVLKDGTRYSSVSPDGELLGSIPAASLGTVCASAVFAGTDGDVLATVQQERVEAKGTAPAYFNLYLRKYSRELKPLRDVLIGSYAHINQKSPCTYAVAEPTADRAWIVVDPFRIVNLGTGEVKKVSAEGETLGLGVLGDYVVRTAIFPTSSWTEGAPGHAMQIIDPRHW